MTHKPHINHTLNLLSKLTGRPISKDELLDTICQILLPSLESLYPPHEPQHTQSLSLILNSHIPLIEPQQNTINEKK